MRSQLNEKKFILIKCEDSGSDSDRPHSSTPTSSSHMNAAAAVAAAAASVPQTGNPLLFPFPSLLANPFLAAANHLHRQHQHHAAAIQPPPPLPHILPQNLTTAHLDGMILDSMLVFKDPTVFWSVVHQLGLFGELMREVSLECGRLLNPNLPKMKIPEVADKLSKIVEVLGIQERLYQSLHTKRCLTKAQTAVLSTEIEGYLLPWVMMNRISELKRKTEESQKRQREMKRKSELFDQLIQPPVKQPRPHSMPSPDESTATTNGRDSSD